MADDGVYNALFVAYTDDGTYSFELTVENVSGATAEGESLFEGEPSSSVPVPPLTRVASIAAVLTGSPGVATATVEFMPEPLDFSARERFLNAYIELPSGLSAANIDPESVAITEVDGVAVSPVGIQPKASVGDFDNDGIADLRAYFYREPLRDLLTPGVHAVRVEGRVDGQTFIGDRNVTVVQSRLGTVPRDR